MRGHFGIAVCACLMLSACLDLPQDYTDLPEVESTDNSPVLEPLSDDGENPEKRGFLAGLLGGAKTADKTALSAPEKTDENTSEGNVATAGQDLGQVTNPISEPAAAKVRRSGLFGFMRRAPALASLAKNATQAESSVPDATVASVAVADAKPNRRKGFSLFRRKAEKSIGAAAADAIAPDDKVKPAAKPVADKPNAPRRRVHGPDKRDVAFGDMVPFGEIVRVCDAPKRKLGKRILQSSGYAIFDSDPKSTDLHAFYVTGFADGCTRQMTAALVTFGSASMHELIRYGLPSDTQPYSSTDKSYEKIKRAICGVGRKKPCGTKVKLLEKNTVFVSYYARFKHNATWSNILLHDGYVVAADSKSGKS